MTKKAEKEENVTVPVGGFHEVWNAKEANELVASGQYYVDKTCSNGKYILVRRS